MISVILIEPEWPSNIGAVARIMANFEFKDLVLVNPKCDINELDAIKRAKHALPILKKVKIVDIKDLKKYDYLVATTSKNGSDYNIKRSPLVPAEISGKLKNLNKKIGIVFGREGEGLHNDEIKMCDLTMTIPSSVKYAALNLSHAVGIVLYELFKETKKKKIGSVNIIGYKEKKELEKLVNLTIDKLDFNTEDKKKNQKVLWKRIIGKSFLTNREAFSLFGFFRKIKGKKE